MHEWTVIFKSGRLAIVYSQKWERTRKTFDFFHVNSRKNKVTVKQFKIEEVKSIQKTWPDVEEVYYA